jgi:hypothetical protein
LLQKYHDVTAALLTFSRGQNFLNTHLIDEVVTLQIGQMRSLFVVCQMRSNSIRHYHYEAPIIHVQPIASTNKLVLGVPREWAIGFRAKIGFVKSGHERQLHKRPNQAHF